MSVQERAINNEATYNKWARWNERNVLTNLIQAEEHARYIDEDEFEPEHIACISKHLLNVRGELGELMTHTDDEEEAERSQEVLTEIEAKLEQLQRDGEIITIDEIKKFRKELEPTMNVFDTADCQSCGELHKLLSERGTSDTHMTGQVLTEEEDDRNIDVEAVDDVDMVAQRRGGSLSAVLDPAVDFTPIPELLGVDSQDVASHWGVPLVGGLTDQSLELFTSELGQRMALGTGILGTQLAIATGRTSGQLTNDFLMLSGVWSAGLLDLDSSEMQELGQNAALFQEGVTELNFNKVVQSLVDTGEGQQLANDMRSALNGGSQSRASQSKSTSSTRNRSRRTPDRSREVGGQNVQSNRTTADSSSDSSSSSATASTMNTDSSPGAGFGDSSPGFTANQEAF